MCAKKSLSQRKVYGKVGTRRRGRKDGIQKGRKEDEMWER